MTRPLPPESVSARKGDVRSPRVRSSRKGSGRQRAALASAVAAVLMLGIVASGCGGSSHTSGSVSTPGTALTKAEFLARANAICASADPALSEASAKLASRPGRAQLAALVRNSYVPLIEGQITRISGLVVPPGERAAVARMLGMVQADLRTLQSRPTLVATDVFADFARVAHPYGLTACAPTS